MRATDDACYRSLMHVSTGYQAMMYTICYRKIIHAFDIQLINNNTSLHIPAVMIEVLPS